MGFFEAVGSVFSKYSEFSGRALRSEYWYWFLFISIISLFVGIASVFFPPLYFIWVIGTFLPNLTVGVRRLHDSNTSGWWILVALIPFVNLILIYWLIKKGESSENRFGMPPIGSKSNNSSAARATRPGEASSSTDSSRGESSTASRAAREASSSTDSSRGEEASSTKPADLYFDNRKSPPKEPVKKQEKPLKDTSSEIDDIFFDNRRKK